MPMRTVSHNFVGHLSSGGGITWTVLNMRLIYTTVSRTKHEIMPRKVLPDFCPQIDNSLLLLCNVSASVWRRCHYVSLLQKLFSSKDVSCAHVSKQNADTWDTKFSGDLDSCLQVTAVWLNFSRLPAFIVDFHCNKCHSFLWSSWVWSIWFWS